MVVRLVSEICTFLLLFLCVVVRGRTNRPDQPPKVFDVVKHGAVAGGNTDNAEAFLKAWKAACAYRGRGRVLIPSGTFLLSPVVFQGPCNGSMSFLIKGTLRAPTSGRNFFSKKWIAFRYVDYLAVKGGGTLDGQGRSAWSYNDCQKNSNCKPLPMSLRFEFVKHSTLEKIRSADSKNAHISLFACVDMNITNVALTAPGDSPNTDGIHIGTSKRIKISHSVIATGDDCIAMVAGSQDIDISDVTCGPGHGISIGSLGGSREGEYVTGISVRNCTFIGTDNGVRIKTWSPSGQSLASNILFEDVVMENVRNPIVIDQNYCPAGKCKIKGQSRVQIKDVTYKNIRGTSSVEVAMDIQCSRVLPCQNVKLIDINLAYIETGRKAESRCSNVIGSSPGKLLPSGCL